MGTCPSRTLLGWEETKQNPRSRWRHKARPCACLAPPQRDARGGMSRASPPRLRRTYAEDDETGRFSTSAGFANGKASLPRTGPDNAHMTEHRGYDIMWRATGGLGLESGFDPPDLDRPGRLPHQQGLCEARLGCQDESPQLGAPGPGLECTCRHCIHEPGKQHGQSGVLPLAFGLWRVYAAALWTRESRAGRVCTLPSFGLWRVCFPPILIRTDRRLLV